MKNKHVFLKAVSIAIALLVTMPQTASTGVRVVPRVNDNTSVTLELQRMFEFEASISLNLRIDPSLVPAARVIELVESIDMRDGSGIAITRGYDLDVEHDLVVAWSGGSAEITRIQSTPQGLVVAGLFKDHQGRIVTPPTDSLAVYTTGGRRLCFEPATVETIPELVPMSFAILIDRSGSMEDVMHDVQDAAATFVDALPDTAICAVGAFSNDWSFSEDDGLGIRPCRASEFDFSQLQAGGTTNLFDPLKASYEWLADPSRTNHQKAVFIITDGQVNKNESERGAVAALKGQTLTFTYFLGDWTDHWLEGLSDNYLNHTGDLHTQLGRYFDIVSSAYRKQTVLQLRACSTPQAVTGHGRP